MTIHTIKLKDLGLDYIQQLKDQHQDLDNEVSIWIRKQSNAMPEEEFWYIISLLNWSLQDNEDIIDPCVMYLSRLSNQKIEAFEDILSKKMYQLDGEQYAKEIGINAYKSEEDNFSADIFLYARCAVIANGQEVFNAILKSPSQMLQNITFEPLLSIASLAYERKTGKEFDYLPAYVYETFANVEGWKNNGLIGKVLDL